MQLRQLIDDAMSLKIMVGRASGKCGVVSNLYG